MTYWKMGVAVPILNNSFRYGPRIYAELGEVFPAGGGAAFPVGTSSFRYDNDTGSDIGHSDGLIKYLRARDRIRIGPSTSSGYEGAYEEFKLTSVTSTDLVVSSPSTVAFERNDLIVGVGSKSAAGWNMTLSTDLSMGGITSHSHRELTDMEGYYDKFSLQFRSDSSTSVYYYFPIEEYIKNIYYRMGFYYQFYESSTATISAVAGTSAGAFLQETVATSSVSSWTAFNSAAAQAPNSYPTTFYVEVTGGIVSGYSIINIDDVYLEHATHTDDESSGVYTFDSYPALGSRSYKIIKKACR